ncbi:hypothetical protein F5877DRAFT_73358 [Lentinula edodes]|nr:hypothetical protein F5877DRAFT_73358 [Lentinula edodes]
METELLPDESQWRRDGRWVQLGLFARQVNTVKWSLDFVSVYDERQVERSKHPEEIEGAETFGLGGREAWIWKRKMGESVLVDDLGDPLGRKEKHHPMKMTAKGERWTPDEEKLRDYC